MHNYQERLEGTAQLFRIRRIKRVLLVVLIVVLVLTSAYALVAGGASLKPLFFPLNAVLPLLLILLLIAGVAILFFRVLEIRYARRDSQRYLIVKKSLRRSTAVLVLAVALGAILLFPWTAAAANAALRNVQSGRLAPGQTAIYTVTNKDVIAFTSYADGYVRVTQGGSGVGLLVDVTWSGGKDSGSATRNNDFRFAFSPGVRAEYNITLVNGGNQPLQYELVLRGALMPELTLVVPVILFLFALVNFFWIGYAAPLRQKYASASIYSVEYEEAADAGERTFAEYYRPTAAPAALPSPPPASVPSASVPIRPALADPEPPPPIPPPPPPEPAVAEGPPAPEAAPELTPEELLEQGSRRFSEGSYEAALSKFDEALEIEPNHVLALLAGGAALLRLGRREEAMRQYDLVLSLDPRNPKALQARAQVFEGDGKWAQAAEAWAAYAGAVPKDVDARLRRAECILNAGDRGGAVKALEEALFLAPSDPRIRERLESLTVNVPALLSRALVASASGQYAEALADFDTILSVDADNVNALVGKGVALRRAGRADDALRVLETAIAKQPGNSAALRAKGAIFEERGDFEKALDAYEDLLEWNPRDPELWAMQGAVLERLDEQEEAHASYLEALKIDPNNREIRERADALESSRKGQEAFLEELFSIKGVGPARARALLAAGYKTVDALRNATEDELANVRGMTRGIAQDIYRHFHPEGAPAPPQGPAPM